MDWTRVIDAFERSGLPQARFVAERYPPDQARVDDDAHAKNGLCLDSRMASVSIRAQRREG